MPVDYDVIVVGGGHAGTEAATMSARLGAKTLLLTSVLDTIGQMSCNPAIGGIAKGTVVREVDALGGIMGRAADRATIQFRMLNRSKGPAVWAPRAQADRTLYKRAVRSLLEQFPALELTQGMVTNLLFDQPGTRISGVETGDGRRFTARAVIITAGTFLRGRIHVGTDTQIPAGRAGDQPSIEMAQVIEGMGLTVARFKTGTPPRVDGRSVNWSKVERQDGESPEFRFSFHERVERPRQVPCWITWAGEDVKDIIQRHLKESALYGGAISGQAPPDLPRAGGARHHRAVRERLVDFPARRRAARVPARRPWARARPDDAAGLRDRVRLLSAHSAHALARGEERRASLLCRSDQRDDGLRGGSGPRRRGRHQRGAPDSRHRAGGPRTRRRVRRSV